MGEIVERARTTEKHRNITTSEAGSPHSGLNIETRFVKSRLSALSTFTLFDLLKHALLRLLIRPPAKKSRPVAEATAGEVIKLHFDY